MPGDNVTINVKLISPIAMEEGLRFAIREGGRTVGAGVVSQNRRVIVYNGRPLCSRGADKLIFVRLKEVGE